MRRELITLVCMLSLFPFMSQSQVKSGIVFSLGDSWMHKKEVGLKYPTESPWGEKDGKWKHRFSYNIGYQFQYEFKSHILIDAALLYQGRRMHVSYTKSAGNTYEKTKLFNGIALNGVVGYKLWKGLKLGIGVEPTIYFNTNMGYNLEDNKFDIPLVAKIGYDFKWFQLDLSYKNGFKIIYRNYAVGKPETRDLQLSIFLPIFK